MNRRRALLVPLLCCAGLPLRAQTNEQAKVAVDGLVAALNADDPELLSPLLSARCTVPGLTPQRFAAVIRRVVAAWQHDVTQHRFELKEAGQLLVTLEFANGGECAYTLRLDAAGRFVELPLFKTEAPGAEPPLTFAGPDMISVPLVPYGGRWSVRATIDGEEGLWMIDTGAKQLVVNTSARAEQPARRDSGTMKLAFSTSVSGTLVTADVIDVDTFAIGSHVATKLQAERTDLTHLTQMDTDGKPIPLMGLIGKRELAAFESRFDFDAATLTLVKLDAAGDPLVPRPAALAERHEFELRNHHARLRFAAGDTGLAMVFDTGADSNLLLEKHLTHAALDVQDVTTAQLKGMSADAPVVKFGRVGGISIDGRPLQAMRTAFVDTAPIGDADGIVGLPWIDRRAFALNYAQKCIVFGPRRAVSWRR